MNYLARLKLLDQQNNSSLSPESVLTKLPKAPSVGFGGMVQGATVKLQDADSTRYANAGNCQASCRLKVLSPKAVWQE